MLPPVNQIAAAISTSLFEIRQKSPRKGGTAVWLSRAERALEPLHEMVDARGFYGIDPATDAILNFLKAANPWTGTYAELARRQLRQHIYNAKESHVSDRSK